MIIFGLENDQKWAVFRNDCPAIATGSMEVLTILCPSRYGLTFSLHRGAGWAR